jgi:hypothetical protein
MTRLELAWAVFGVPAAIVVLLIVARSEAIS